MTQPLSLSLRPTTLDAFIGNSAVTSALKKQLSERIPTAILLSAPPGFGKTSLSKIIARMANPDIEEEKIDLTEVNGSSENGIDGIRVLIDQAKYRPFSGRRVIVINEAQGLTSAAKQALLDPLESTDGSNLWIFTSMAEKMDKDDKLDKAFRRRCVHYVLKPMTEPEIRALVQRAAENSTLEFDTTTFVQHIITSKIGSPGEIIAAWEKYSSGTPLKDCLIDANYQAEYRDIALSVVNGDWNKCRALLQNVQTGDSRALRSIVSGFLGSALVKQDVGPKADAIATCLMGLGAAFEDGIAWGMTRAAFYKCAKAIAGAK